MGAGGRMDASSTGQKDVLERVPAEKPPFTIADLKKAIPPHCFKPSLIRSFAALFRDMAMVYTLYYLAANYIPVLPQTLSYIAWPVYWYFQGSMIMGLWIIGHECSHHAFSKYEWLDDVVGFIVHSICLTPYFSFKYSHRRHHAHTNSIEYDTVFVPKRKSDKLYSEFLNNPLGLVFRHAILLTIGLPMYFSFNFLGRDYEGFANHFFPKSPIFNDRERPYVWLSNAGIFSVLYALYHLMSVQGATWAFCLYVAPLIAEGTLFIVLTFLHHTHPAVPHYDSTEWDWLRGALCTVDRDYGFLNWAFHHSTDAHLVHHLLPSIPHYHALEATEAIKPILGKYYKFDDTPIIKAFWREMKECIYAEPDEGAKKNGVYWYYK